MRYLLLFEAALLALAATMALVLGVVCILYVSASGMSARVDAEMPALVTSTLIFTALSAVLGAAVVGLWRRRSWNLAAQVVAAVITVAGSTWLYRLYT